MSLETQQPQYVPYPYHHVKSIIEQILSSIPSTIHPSIPKTPPHNTPTLAFAIHPASRCSNDRPLILGLSTNPDVLVLRLQDVEWNGATVKAEESLQCAGEVEMCCYGVQGRSIVLLLLRAEMPEMDVAPGWVAQGLLEEDMWFLVAFTAFFIGRVR